MLVLMLVFLTLGLHLLLLLISLYLEEPLVILDRKEVLVQQDQQVVQVLQVLQVVQVHRVQLVRKALLGLLEAQDQLQL